MRRLVIAATAALLGCGSPAQEGAPTAGAGLQGATAAPIRLRHQIMVEYGEEAQVFEGYMVLGEDAFLVKAFAGPGVDLFTVVRNGARRRDELHMPALEGRIDLEAVGDDIARVYLRGCAPPAGAAAARCDFHGEPLEEDYDAEGRTIERRFPKAHGIGVRVTYRELSRRLGETVAGRIELRWGAGGNRMAIVLVDAQRLDRSALELLEP